MIDTASRQRAIIELRSVAPVFLVPDVNATAEWYAEHPGFETARSARVFRALSRPRAGSAGRDHEPEA
jgi:hypothetical protein